MTEIETERPRWRNLVGMMILIIGLTAYAFLAAAIGETLAGLWLPLEILFYVFAGIVWIFPARSLLRWMAPPQTDN